MLDLNAQLDQIAQNEKNEASATATAEAPKAERVVATRNRKPRMTPPKGGFTSFPVEGFDPNKYGYPIKEDFSPEGPYYEEFKLAQLDEEINKIQAKKKEFLDEIEIWRQAGGDRELVERRRNSLKAKNRLSSEIAAKQLSPEDLAAILEQLKQAGLLNQ